MKSLSASQLRANVYLLLDEVIETGKPLEIQRGKNSVRIIPAVPVKRTDRLKKRNWIVGDPNDLVTVNWPAEWNRDLP
jgi:prevent-host-death family protein